MKTWGRNGWGALLAVLLLLVGGIVLPLSAQGQGKRLWGQVTDCATTDPVAAVVTLVDAHAQAQGQNQSVDALSGIFIYTPEPGYYVVRVTPNAFTHYTREAGPYRFDGTVHLFVPSGDLCVDPMPKKDRWLNVTVLDGSTNSASETVAFEEFSRGAGGTENATKVQPDDTVQYDYLSGNFTLKTRPLGWDSARLVYRNDTTPIQGAILNRTVHYDYTTQDAFNGAIHIINGTIRTQLENTLFGRANRGYLVATYSNVSQSSSLSHGYVTNEQFFKNGSPMSPLGVLNFTRETGAIYLYSDQWKYGSKPTADRLSVTYDWSDPIGNARVTVRDPAKDQAVVAPATTPASGTNEGKVSFQVYAGSFEVKVDATSYQPQVPPPVDTTAGDQNVTVYLFRGHRVFVVVHDADINPIEQGLSGVLINTNASINRQIKVLQAAVQDNTLTFFAYNGTWKLVVDAKGYAANTSGVNVTGGTVNRLITLIPSAQERYETSISFNGQNWSALTVWRNVTLLPDSDFPGIENGFLHDLGWQLDLKFGTTLDGTISPAERLAVENFIAARGPFYTVTDDFLTVNGRTYRSVVGSYVQQVVNNLTAGGNFEVRAGMNYTLSDTTKPIIPQGQAKYWLNMTTIADKNVTQYQNYSFLVQLPPKYEMTSRTLTGNITTRDFVNVTLDPGIDAAVPNPRANMIVEFSLTGIARAEVEGPVGKVRVEQADQEKGYLAWVANDTAIVFSANKTTDRGNLPVNAKDAAFNWTFIYNATGNPVGNETGIWTTFDFGNLGGNYTVNLTVTQVNPTNVTYRVINVTVDNEDPAGAFRTDRTGTKVHNVTGNRYNASGVRDNNLTVDEDLFTTFTALDDRVPLSSDILNGTLKGKVAQWKWDFESDGTYDRTGQSTSWNYSKPGNFVLNLTVVDSVGHEGANVTMNVTVRDVTPPVIGFVILDPNNAWRETSTLSEGKIYFFNASRTTDNSLNTTEDNVNLSYRWKWGVGEGQNGTDLGMRDWRNRGNNTLNVSHVWTKWGDYKLEITVWDASDKNATVTRSPFPIQANTSAHPNLSIRSGSLKINPTTPEEGQQVTFTFNITNAKGSGNATQIRVMLAIRERNQDKNESSESFDVRFLNGSAVVTNPVLTPEWNLTVEITWHAPNKVANHSLRITVWDANEPTPWIDAGNRQDTSLLVKEAGWKFWAIVGAFLFVIFGLPILYYVVRKFRAGEWTLRRKRGEEGEEEEEEEEDEEEEDEEEEEVAGEKPRKKKRL